MHTPDPLTHYPWRQVNLTISCSGRQKVGATELNVRQKERHLLTTRTQALRAVLQVLLPQIENLYAIKPDHLQLYSDYEGCQNLVFFYARETTDYVLRVSYRDDRTSDQIHAELDFIHFLYEHGVRVSPPIKSREGRYVEVLSADDRQLVFVAFAKAPGHRLNQFLNQLSEGRPEVLCEYPIA